MFIVWATLALIIGAAGVLRFPLGDARKFRQ
jgi:hypothetical protein